MSQDWITDFLDAPSGNPAPAYLRLRRVLKRGIECGALDSGQALPSERELARRLDVSRVTVRKALAGLVADGLLQQRHGAGTFVADRIVKPMSRLTSFTEDLHARGLKPRSHFLEREIGSATPQEAMALNLSPGADVVRLYRIRYGAEQPLAIERSSVPLKYLPDPERVTGSLYQALSEWGRRPVRALQRLHAVNFDSEQARLLHVPEGSAGLAIERRAFLADDSLVEYTRSWYRSDAYDFVAELHAEATRATAAPAT